MVYRKAENFNRTTHSIFRSMHWIDYKSLVVYFSLGRFLLSSLLLASAPRSRELRLNTNALTKVYYYLI